MSYYYASRHLYLDRFFVLFGLVEECDVLSRAVKSSRKPAGGLCLQQYKQLAGVFCLFFVLGFGLSLIVSACSPSPSNSPVANSTSSPAHNLVLRIGHQKFDPLILILTNLFWRQ